jgi:hypothetical protein
MIGPLGLDTGNCAEFADLPRLGADALGAGCRAVFSATQHECSAVDFAL